LFRFTPRKALLAGGLVAMIGAPAVAVGAGEGLPLDGGARNPSSDSRQSYTRETEIIANTDTYGTRQSNKSASGGGAVYGCRSRAGGTPARNEPCVRSTNLADGLAFEFATGGVLGGTIQVGNGGDDRKPFTTNATGVATGLNADEVDGRSADDFVLRTGKAADADQLDGRDSASFASASNFAFAAVSAAGNVTAGRGATSASVVAATNTFTVTFDRDVAACSYTVTQNATAASDVTFAASSASARTVTVDQTGDGTDPAVPFHLQVIC
jgi:hypothetical protein